MLKELNLSSVTSFFNAEEIKIEHFYDLYIDLETGVVKCPDQFDSKLVYNYSIIHAEKDGIKKDIPVGSLDVLSDENLEELREFFGYNEDAYLYDADEEEGIEYKRNLDDDDEEENSISRGY